MIRGPKSIAQFAILGAVIGFLFGVFWWIANRSGFRYDTTYIDFSQVITIVLAPGLNLLRGTDGAWLDFGQPWYGSFSDNVQAICFGTLFNCIIYSILGTLAVAMTASVRFLRKFAISK